MQKHGGKCLNQSQFFIRQKQCQKPLAKISKIETNCCKFIFLAYSPKHERYFDVQSWRKSTNFTWNTLYSIDVFTITMNWMFSSGPSTFSSTRKSADILTPILLTFFQGWHDATACNSWGGPARRGISPTMPLGDHPWWRVSHNGYSYCSNVAGMILNCMASNDWTCDLNTATTSVEQKVAVINAFILTFKRATPQIPRIPLVLNKPGSHESN